MPSYSAKPKVLLMDKTIFEITKMDCSSEENLIRMKMERISSIKNFYFAIPNRKLIVFS
jgi:hypothetical protein